MSVVWGSIPHMTTPSIKLTRSPLAPTPMELDAQQDAAVAHRGSPLLIAGGPGTGKSALMVERALSYIEEGIDPNQILLLTFDRERATELNDAIVSQIPKSINGAIVKTIPKPFKPEIPILVWNSSCFRITFCPPNVSMISSKPF